jgi:hypothetical protein
MKPVLVSLMLMACGGTPTQAQLAATPIATTKTTPGEAPAASMSDEDREEAIKQTQSMEDAETAYRQAQGTGSAAPEPTAVPTPEEDQATETPTSPIPLTKPKTPPKKK